MTETTAELPCWDLPLLADCGVWPFDPTLEPEAPTWDALDNIGILMAAGDSMALGDLIELYHVDPRTPECLAVELPEVHGCVLDTDRPLAFITAAGEGHQ